MLKILWQLLLVPIFVCIWLFSAASVGVDVSFENGTALRLRGWWKD